MKGAAERTKDFPAETMLRVGDWNEKDNQTKGNTHVRNSSDARG
jgi:hypothetical protein